MKKTLFSVLLSILIASPSFILASGKDDYKKGWDEFFKNNRTEARKLFTSALNDESTKADAYLSLGFLDWSESKMEDAFAKLEGFCNSSSDPAPYLYGIYSLPFAFGGGDVMEKNKVDLLEKVIETPIHGTLKAMIYISLGKHYMGCNDFDKANILFDKAGALKNWQVLGTFNNVSGSGFDKEWGALQKSQPGDKFTDKVGATVNWYTPSCNKEDGWFNFNYCFIFNNIIAYAQTFVNSPSAQEVYLRTGTSGSVKIWINDAAISSVIDERNCDLDVYSYKIKLNKGVNRILIQVGQSYINEANFLMRITDAGGNPVEGLTHKAEYAKYTKSSAKNSNDALPLFAEVYLINKVKEEPENPINYLILGETYLRNDKADEATAILRKLQDMAPVSSLVQYRLAEAYSRAHNTTYHTKEIENIKKGDPDSFYALDFLGGEAIKSKKITEVKNINQKVKDLYGENTTTRSIDLWLASQQGDQQTLIAISKANYEKYPYRYDYMNSMFSIEEYTLKNSKAATAIVEDYCSKYFSASALETLSNRYIKEGDTEKGLKILYDRIEKLPYATGYLYSLANTLYQMQRYQEALDVVDRIYRLSQYLPRVYVLRADIYKAMKDEKKAIENYKKSIEYDPSLFSSRTQLIQLEKKKEINDLFPKYNLDSLISDAPTQNDFPNDHSIVLLNETKTVFYPEGATEYLSELAVKILNQSGIEAWKEYQIGYYGNQSLTLDKSEIIKANGQKVKAETNGNNHIVFTNLEVNDVLYLEYRIKDMSTDVLSKHISVQNSFKYFVPTVVNSYSILAPKDKKIDYIVTNGKIDPKISDVEGMKLYHWSLNNQESFKSEPYMSPLVDIAPTLTVGTVPDWTFISAWYKDLTANKFKDDYLLKETMADILKGKESATQLEKAELFYDYIMKNITYSNVPFMQNNFIPQMASRTISTRLGDCKDMSTLFVAMCRKTGIQANLVLIITRDNGENILPLPANRFNHCIAQFVIDGRTYYVELTDNRLSFGSAIEFDLHSWILPIPYGDEKGVGDNILKMDMPFRTSNSLVRETNFKIENNDVITLTKTIRTGSRASYLRQLYADLGQEDRLKEFSQIIAADYTTPVKVTSLVFDDLTSLSDTAVYSYGIEAKNIVQEIAGMKIFKIRWSDGISSQEEFSVENRKTPFELWIYMMEDFNDEEFTIELPEGRKMVEVPKDVHLECANLSYDLKYDAQTPGKVKVRRIMKRKTEKVSLEEYNAFKDFMHSVSEYDNKQYAIN